MTNKNYMLLILGVFTILGILCNGCASARYSVSCSGDLVKGHCTHHKFVDRSTGAVYWD